MPRTATPARCLVHEPLLLRLSDQYAIHVITLGTHSWHERRRVIYVATSLILVRFTSRRLILLQTHTSDILLFGSLRASHPGFARSSLLVLTSCDLIRSTFRFSRGHFFWRMVWTVETIGHTYAGVLRTMHDALLSPAKSAIAMDAQRHPSAYWSTTTYCLWICFPDGNLVVGYVGLFITGHARYDA